jgi:type VI secretion system protein ImpH
MADAARQSTDALERLRDIEARFASYEFYAAMRLVECAHPAAPRLGRAARASEESVRLGQVPSLAFAPATFLAADRRADGRLWLGAAFFGVFGPNGPLPLHLTEYAHDRRHNFRDDTLARFADVFHHRLLCLFYRGWADAQPTVHADRPDSDRFRTYVGALLGLGTPALRGRDAMPDPMRLHFAGRLASQVRNPEGIQAMLSEYFHERVRIAEFRGEWMALDAEDRLYLGRSPRAGALGAGATLGPRVWGVQSKFRIVLGSMPFARFERFLPGSTALGELSAIVRNLVGFELEWELQLVVDRDEVPPVCLGAGARLGYSAWLVTRQRTRDADDVVLTRKN